MISVAVVGTGNISPSHLSAYQAFADRCRIVALCDIAPAKAEAVRRELGLEDAAVHASHTEVIARGDVDLVSIGTEGFIEQRKYLNLGTQEGPGHLFLANGEQETHVRVAGTVGYPYFGQLVLDCLERTENAMTQHHAFKAIELAVQAQNRARDLSRPSR